jgi:hypothetical protein
MNPAEAIAANLARLSYNASLRARAALRRAAARLSVGQVRRIFLKTAIGLRSAEAIACARRCRSSQLTGWWTQKE